MEKRHAAAKEIGRQKNSAATAVQQILSLFGPPPLLSTERREHFEQILAQLITAIAPADAIVQMWVYDIAVLVWEMMRLRRYKAALFEEALPRTIRGIAREFIGDSESDQLKDFDLVEAEAFRAAWKSQEVEPMLASLEVRRDAIIREVGAYCDSLARRVKKAVDDVIEVPGDCILAIEGQQGEAVSYGNTASMKIRVPSDKNLPCYEGSAATHSLESANASDTPVAAPRGILARLEGGTPDGRAGRYSHLSRSNFWDARSTRRLSPESV